MRLLEEVNNTKGNAGGCGEAGQVLSPDRLPFPLATIKINMEGTELTRLQDEALSYLRNNITKDEAYYILTTDKDMTEVIIADKKDGNKRIKILDTEYTIEKDDMLLLFDTDGLINECLLTSSYIGINMYFRRQDIHNILSFDNGLTVMGYQYIKAQVDNIPVVEKRRVVLEMTGHRIDRDDRDKIDFMFIYFMARLCA